MTDVRVASVRRSGTALVKIVGNTKPGSAAHTIGIAWIAGMIVAHHVGEVLSPGLNSVLSLIEARARIVDLIEIGLASISISQVLSSLSKGVNAGVRNQLHLMVRRISSSR